MAEMFEREKQTDKKDEQYYRKKVQAWCKIMGNRQRIAHRERHSFINWCLNQAKVADQLRPKDLYYLKTVASLKHAAIARANLKRAKEYERAVMGLRQGILGPTHPEMYKHIIKECFCSKCISAEVQSK